MRLVLHLVLVCGLILLVGAKRGPPFYSTSQSPIQAVDCFVGVVGHNAGGNQNEYHATRASHYDAGQSFLHPESNNQLDRPKQQPQSTRWSVPNDELAASGPHPSHAGLHSSATRNNNEPTGAEGGHHTSTFDDNNNNNQVIRGGRQARRHRRHHGSQPLASVGRRTFHSHSHNHGGHDRFHRRRDSRNNHGADRLASHKGQTSPVGEINGNHEKSNDGMTNPLIESSSSDKVDDYASGPMIPARAGARRRQLDDDDDDDEQADEANNRPEFGQHKNTGHPSGARYANGGLGRPPNPGTASSPPIDRFDDGDGEGKRLPGPHKVPHNHGGVMRDWCHMSCSNHHHHHGHQHEHPSAGINNNGPGAEGVVCASNGRLYGSMCELRRQACLDNVHLFKRPISDCASSFPPTTQTLEPRQPPPLPPPPRRLDTNKHSHSRRHHQPLANFSEDHELELPVGQSSEAAGTNLKQDDKVRFIQLKGHCGRPQLDGLKLALLRQFNGQIDSLFRYLDTNHDGLIEARELWPRYPTHTGDADDDDDVGAGDDADGNHGGGHMESSISAIDDASGSSNAKHHTTRSRPPQLLWENEASDCRDLPAKNVAPLHYHSGNESQGCWYFVDFAFEPYHEGNPCSLSHLMLFDSDHPNDRFDYNTFYRSITNLRTTTSDEPTNNNNDRRSPSNQRRQRQQQQQQSDEVLLRTTRLTLRLGESRSLDCLPPDLSGIDTNELDNDANNNDFGVANTIEDRAKLLEAISQVSVENKCYWSRYNKPLATVQDAHIAIGGRSTGPAGPRNAGGNSTEFGKSSLALHVKAAQLYLSGQFKCTCQLENPGKSLVHQFDIQVIAEPKVTVRPGYQWSLPRSRVQFECQHDFIDTRLVTKNQSRRSFDNEVARKDTSANLFDLQIDWFKQDVSQDTGSPNDHQQPQGVLSTSKDDEDNWETPELGIINKNGTTDPHSSELRLKTNQDRISISMASTKLALESLQQNDTADYVCRVEVPVSGHGIISAEGRGSLLVQEQPESYQQQTTRASQVEATHLWVFHDNGISVFRLQTDDGQELELLREINGHSLVSPEVDGNWNQLTLCGGLNQEQVVICEWSDNALYLNVEEPGEDGDGIRRMGTSGRFKDGGARVQQRYIYVGQPNLNRVIVMDGIRFEIVAIINTEPQPRKLFPARPNKIHLNKWVRRRLSPVANARWRQAIGRHAHDLHSIRESQLYSHLKAKNGTQQRQQQRVARHTTNEPVNPQNQHQPMPSKLVQHDIWLLCYGQPMVVSPAGDDQTRPSEEQDSSIRGPNVNGASLYGGSRGDSVQPFTPHLPIPGNSVPLAWSIALQGGTVNAREAKLRNRKSVQIIQTTFFPSFLYDRDDGQNHSHNHEVDNDQAALAPDDYRQRYGAGASAELSSAAKFKRLTVLTTHYVFTGLTVQNGAVRGLRSTTTAARQRYLDQPRFDLIQDLSVPVKPYPLKNEPRYNMHYTYVTHYDEQRLYRVSMDAYRYDREIDLQNCDPINLVSTAQGLLIIQCRAPITHDLLGQLILDELTSSEVEFNPNVCAQEAYLSPDNRYLVSIYTNTTSGLQVVPAQEVRRPRATATNQQQPLAKRQSIIYVQSISVEGLKLQYEIKTSLEISRCSFVWKDGYYAAIFVSTNHEEQQSEVLSLRLADGRLELIVRVAGVVNASRHKEALNVLPELQIAALSTSKGTYVVDLEENRVTQTLNHHQSIPTLLWV